MKKTPINYALSEYNFGELSTRENNPRARIRLLILHQYSIGKTTPEISQSTYVSEHTVMKTRREYWQKGLSIIYDQPRSGRRKKLDKQYEDEFKALIVKEQESKAGGRLVCDDIVELAQTHFKADYSRNGMYHVLKRIGMSWVSARSQHPQADEAKQESFKKL